jgi:hypothetical protein
MNRTQTNAGNRNDNDNNNISNVTLHLVMSCDIFWKYEMDIAIDRRVFDPEMKKHIHADLTQNAEYGLIRKLEEVFPKFHIHGLTTHEILYPFDPHNSAHSRGDGKIFICTHC